MNKFYNLIPTKTQKELKGQLTKQGFEKTISKDGKAELFKKSGDPYEYMFRQESKSFGKKPTVDVRANGKTTSKIRLTE